MNRVTAFLLGLGSVYVLLFLLSILFIIPRYLPGGFTAYFFTILTDTEPEGPYTLSVFAALTWLIIPLASTALCLLSWVSYTASTKLRGWTRSLGRFGFGVLVAASIFPGLLTVRELLLYHSFGLTSPDLLAALTDLLYAVRLLVNPSALLGTHGVWVVPLVVFAETGLFFGFFLPGDSLLLTLGVLGAVGRVNLSALIILSIIGAVLGGQVGYATGRRIGDALERRYRFAGEGIRSAQAFYANHGGKTVVLARFFPVVRTFAPIVAGAVGMNYYKFTVFNIAGAALWVVCVTLAGFVVGRQLPVVVNYLDTLILAVVLSSPLIWIATWAVRRHILHTRQQ